MIEHVALTKESLAALGTLYKYRDAKTDWNWAVLENQELYFPNPSSFNDPFDANINMRFDLMKSEDRTELIKDWARKKYASAGPAVIQAKIRQLSKLIIDPESHDEAMQKWIRRLTSKMRVFCICPERDNILLWSHYGSNHTGFAIGFESMQLHALWQASNGLQMGYVAYGDTYPILLPPDQDDKKAKIEIITTIMNLKSSIWAYEKEVRMTMFDGPEKVRFEPALIKEVVLGCKMSSEHQQKMLKIMSEKYPHASVYRAKMRRGAFALDFDKL